MQRWEEGRGLAEVGGREGADCRGGRKGGGWQRWEEGRGLIAEVGGREGPGRGGRKGGG